MKKKYAILMNTFALAACLTCQSPKDQQSQNLLLPEADASAQQAANRKINRLQTYALHAEQNSSPTADSISSYYGGAFVSDLGRLVVQLLPPYEQHKAHLKSIIGTDDITFQEAEFSYAFLTMLMDSLNTRLTLPTAASPQHTVDLYYVSDMDNRIVVEMQDLQEDAIADFKENISNSAAIAFKQATATMVLQQAILPGCKAAIDAAGISYGSIGFPARSLLDSSVGIVTAGHVIQQGQTLYHLGKAVGTCSQSQISGTIDAAFVPIADTLSYPLRNTLCGQPTEQLSTLIDAPGVGTLINKRGFSTKHTSGKIISTNATWLSPSTNQMLTHMSTADYSSAAGDSGGIVYSFLSASNQRPTLGIHIGVRGNIRYFVKAQEIAQVMNLVRF